MTKNRSMKIAVLVLALALLTSCFVGSTFAKYTSTGTGSSVARAAVWNVTTGKDGAAVAIAGDNSVTFELFESVNDPHVKDGGTAENIIAPGTAGEFALTVNNGSEVDAAYSITFVVTNDNNIPVKFSTDGNTWTSDIAELTGDLAMENGTETKTVQWKWDFNDGGVDNEFANKSITVKATVTVSQVD